MTTSGLEHETPLLSILAVRDQLAPFSELAPFESDVEASIRRSARTGSLDDLAQTLRTWLGIALQARWAAEGRLVRGSEREAAVDAWITAHPEFLHR